MTLTIQTTEDSQRQLTLTIEVEEARVQKAMREKARSLSRDISLPGFRPGKAPYDVVVRRVGEATLRAEAIEDLIQPVFEEAMADTGADMYGRPSLDNIDPQPLVFTFTVPLSPVVTLGDYRSHRKEIEPIAVTDEAVQEALEYAQGRRANLEAVDRPAEAGDVVTIGGLGTLAPAAPAEGETPAVEADETIFREEHAEVLLDSKTLFPGTPFVDNLVGMSVGEQKTFSFTFTGEQEYEKDFAGREANFDITMLEIKRRELPPLDDDFAKSEGNFETLDDLRAEIRQELTSQAEESQKETTIEEMIDYLVEDATIVYPPAAVDLQIDDMVEDFKNRLQRSSWDMADYLQLNGQTEETLREDFRENAERSLKRQLALRQMILEERVRVEVADIEGLIEERVARFDNDVLKDSMREYYRSGRGFDSISSEVLRDKIFDRIKAILSGDAPDLDQLEAEALADAAAAEALDLTDAGGADEEE